VCYEAVLQQYGWKEGWPYLMQITANSRVIADSSSGVPNEIATGNALAGPCVDFYAYARIDQAGADTLRFVLPRGGAAMTPDPISMLRNPPHPELATKFMSFILSPAGQRLWCITPGKAGGPKRHRLYRTPSVAGLTDPSGDAITGAVTLESVLATAMPSFDPKIQRTRVELLSELMGAALVDQHQDLTQAWKALIDGGMKEAALAEWNRLPFEESQSEQLSQRLGGGQRERRDLTREWRQFFSEKYKRVQELSR
jgi:spermidine/putrescine-binding protein